MKKLLSKIASLLLTGLLCSSIEAQLINQKTVATESRYQVERAIAATFAPVFYQGLGDQPRFDYITGFNFDRDWRGDNNWRNAESRRFPLKAYIYYSVTETTSHYFVHYAVFHPIDYKGAAFRGKVGALNMARPPWAWFDSTEREQPLGEWFFDPAKTIKRHFNLGDDFSTIYVDGIIVRLASR